MKFHDIVCHEDGWSHLVDGVRRASFPSWFIALNAARRAAEQDASDGVTCSVRFQSKDGSMLPVQRKIEPASGMRFGAVKGANRAEETPRLAG